MLPHAWYPAAQLQSINIVFRQSCSVKIVHYLLTFNNLIILFAIYVNSTIFIKCQNIESVCKVSKT